MNHQLQNSIWNLVSEILSGSNQGQTWEAVKLIAINVLRVPQERVDYAAARH